MVQLKNAWDLTPENVAKALFDNTQDPFEVIKSLGRLAGDDVKDDIMEIKGPFTLEVDRGKLSKEEAVSQFTQALEERASEFNLR
ncbi:MAG: hypothetical protein ACPG05_01530 [Bdellovibrionales bacterium]